MSLSTTIRQEIQATVETPPTRLVLVLRGTTDEPTIEVSALHDQAAEGLRACHAEGLDACRQLVADLRAAVELLARHLGVPQPPAAAVALALPRAGAGTDGPAAPAGEQEEDGGDPDAWRTKPPTAEQVASWANKVGALRAQFGGFTPEFGEQAGVAAA